MLKQRITLYKKKGVSLQYKHQQAQLKLICDNKPFYKEVHSQVLQNVLRTLDTSYQNFFRRVKKGETPGFPRFKGKDRMDSFTYPQSGFKTIQEMKQIRLSKIGHVKCIFHREIEGKITRCCVKKSSSGKWYVCLTTDLKKCEKVIPPKETINPVGIDLGINRFITTHDGKGIKTEKHLKKRSCKLKRLQRSLSRKPKTIRTINKVKARLLLAKQHEKVVNSRNDFQHKSANKLLNNYDLFVFENLKIMNMKKSSKGTIENPGKMVKQKSGLNRSISDMAWRKFVNILTYKAEEAGKDVFFVDPKNTSQLCSNFNCQEKVHKHKYRVHDCPYCAVKLDRDHNAAINILNRFLSTVGTTESYACGNMIEVTRSAQEAHVIALA